MSRDAGVVRDFIRAHPAYALCELQARSARLELTASDGSRAVPDDPGARCCGYCGVSGDRVALTHEDGFAEPLCDYTAGCIARRRLRFPDREYPWAAEVRSRAEAARRDLEAIRLAVACFGDVDLPALELRLSKSAVLATEQARRARRADWPRTDPAPRPVPAGQPCTG